jgi:hypothetical protein
MSFDEQTDAAGPLRQRKFLTAAVVIAAVVVLGVLVTAMSLLGGDDPEATTGATDGSATPATPPAAEEGDRDASLCGLEGRESNGSLGAPPEDVTWQLVDTFALPSSAADGPGETDESGVRYCYARTREGAVLMAASILAWSALDGDEVAAAILEHSIASGPGYDVIAEEVEKGEALTGDGRDENRLQIAGFQLVSYTADAAVVDVVVKAATGQLASTPVELAWERGDWRVRPAPDGTLIRPQPVPDLTGYVAWAGV